MDNMENTLREFKLTRSARSKFLRYFFLLLVNKYHVDYIKVARSIGRNPTYIYQWLNEYKGKEELGYQVMDDLERYMYEMYYPLLKDELDIHGDVVNSLREESDKEYKEIIKSLEQSDKPNTNILG